MSDEADLWFERAVEASNAGRSGEAREGFERVVALDPNRGEAWLGLGLQLTAERRFDEAEAPLRRACAMPGAPSLWWTCLGQALYMAGRFADSAGAFRRADGLEPLGGNARQTWARAEALAALSDGDAGVALDLYRRLAGEDADTPEAFANEALAVLGVFGHREAAKTIGRWLVGHAPSNVLYAYGLQALEEAEVTRAPAAYVETLFDQFADRFDEKLVAQLDYHAPAWMSEQVAAHRTAFDSVLDLGCGTGLSAEPLRRFGGRLTGVDISARMLERAAARGDYAELVQTDILAFLPNRPGAFDLVFAADVLIYFGDLAPVVESVAAALRPDGLFAFSTELGERDWKLLSSGRFSHGLDYLAALAGPEFEIIDTRQAPLRREGAVITPGVLSLWRRR